MRFPRFALILWLFIVAVTGSGVLYNQARTASNNLLDKFNNPLHNC